MNEKTKCNDCPKFKTHANGWKYCGGNSCEIDVRNKTIDELIHELKHRETTIYETGFMCHEYSDDELDEIAEQMKGETK